VKWRLGSSGKQDNVLVHMTIVMITCVIHGKTPSKMKLELWFLVSHMENCHGRTQEKLILVTKMLVELWTVLKMCMFTCFYSKNIRPSCLLSRYYLITTGTGKSIVRPLTDHSVWLQQYTSHQTTVYIQFWRLLKQFFWTSILQFK